jgi:hypothetical protein
MSMDGGRESEMVIVRGAFRYASFGAWTGEEEHPDDARGSGAAALRDRHRAAVSDARGSRAPCAAGG